MGVMTAPSQFLPVGERPDVGLDSGVHWAFSSAVRAGVPSVSWSRVRLERPAAPRQAVFATQSFFSSGKAGGSPGGQDADFGGGGDFWEAGHGDNVAADGDDETRPGGDAEFIDRDAKTGRPAPERGIV